MRFPSRTSWLLGALLAAACSGGSNVPSSNADLAALEVSTGVLSPAFSAPAPAYTVGPATLAADVTVTATTADAGAVLLVNGVVTTSGLPSAPIGLGMGETEVSIVVTAADGATQLTYTVIFDRTSADLAGLVVSAGALSPDFDPTTGAYGVGPSLLESSTTVTAVAEDPDATILVNSTPVASGAPSGPIALSPWLSVVTVEVRARDGATTRDYVVAFDRSVGGQEAYLKASNTGAGDFFGPGVAVSGDTVVVGAPFEGSSATGVDGNGADDSAGGAGAAYVFVRSGGAWTQQAYLKASNTGAGDNFGLGVAAAGDTIVVGASQEDGSATGVDGNGADDGATFSGAAYVFVRSGGAWTEQAYLKASNTGVGDRFGWSVAVSGDTVVVGARNEDSSATGVDGDGEDDSATIAGAAYVFVRSGGAWTQQAYLKASNTGEGDIFGYSVAVSGDTVVVGAFGEDSSATGVDGNGADDSAGGAGAAYVFVRSGGTWTQQAYLKASNTGADDAFGYGVAVSGDTVVAGAVLEASSATGVDGNGADDGAKDAGAAYVFR